MPRNAAETKRLLKQARDRWTLAEEADEKQVERELEALAFYSGDQWPADIEQARKAQTPNPQNGMPASPARPCITVNKTREPVRQVLNQERGSQMGIELDPADDFGQDVSDEEVELREGLVRRIQRESEASDARTWAFARAVQAGRGFYGVSTRYVAGKTRDQEIYLRRFWNQACVKLDPAHEQPDGSDSEWGLIGVDMRWDGYKAEYPTAAHGAKNRVTDLSLEDFRSLGDEAPGWFKTEGDERMVRVVEYYYTERDVRTLAMLADGRDEWEDELSEADKATDYETREVITKSVKWCKLDGAQILDETDWPGQYIPLIKVLGEELQPYDQERRVEGMVQSMIEPGRGFNYMVSKWVETVALSPIPPLLMAEGQAESYESWYAAANTRTLPYLYYRQRDLNGQSAGPPTTPARDIGAVIGPLAMSVQMFSEALQSVSSIHDPSLGKVDHSTKSGVAIRALQQQGQQGTSNFLDNLTRSIRYEGRIINDLLYAIYGRPGRIARILNPEGDSSRVLLHQPSVMGQAGRPTPAQPGQPNAKTYTLTKDAVFNIAINVTRSYDTRRAEEAATIGDLLNGNPALMTVLGDLYFKNLDGPGHDEMAERVKAMLDPKVQAVLQAKQQGQGPPDPHTQQLMSENAQLKQVAQQLQQAVQTDQVKAQASMQTAQVKAQADMQMAQLQAQKEIHLQEMKNAASIAVARISAAKSAMDTAAEGQEERLSTGIELQHEAQQNALDRAHQVGMSTMASAQGQQGAAADQAHQQQMAAQGQQASSAEADASRQHDAEMQAQQQAASAEQPPQGAGA